MSCATLKRPLDSDLFSPNSRGPTAKRRRLAAARGLFGINPHGLGGSSSSNSSASSISASRDESPFSSSVSVSSARLSPEQMQVRLRQEIRSLRRLKQLHGGGGGGGLSPTRVSASGGASPSSFDNFGENMKTGVGMSKDSALFTFRQVGLICDRMLQEKETALRQEYEQVLSTKLAEQYDQFVKFTHDQIQKSFEAASAPSYLS